MTDKAHRKELKTASKAARPAAGVYRIVNRRTGRVLLGSTVNLDSARHKLDFARSSGVLSVLDERLRDDARAQGADAFAFEVLEELEITPEMTRRQVDDDLATLASLWRDKLQPADWY